MLNQELSITYLETKTLRPWARNPRHNDQTAELLVRLISRFGFIVPIEAQAEKRSGKHRVINGHARLKAAHLLDMDVVPVILLDVDDEIAAEIALTDNKASELARWDNYYLSEIMESRSQEHWEWLGFEQRDFERVSDEVKDFGPLERTEIEGEFAREPMACRRAQ